MTTFKTSDNLFNLVKRLSKSEKRFFTMYSDFQTGDKIYLQIFKAMDKMKEYDEGKLLAIFKSTDMAEGEKRRKIAVNKNYLYNQVLRSLRIFNNEKESIDILLYNLLVDVQALRGKGLFQLALKRLNKAKKIATEYEKLLMLLEIIALEIDINIEHRPKGLKKNVDKLYRQKNTELNRVKEYLELKSFDKQLFVSVRLRKEPLADNFLHAIEALDCFENQTFHFSSFHAENHYYNLMALYYLYVKKNLKTASHYRHKVLELWRTNDKIRKNQRHEYKLAIANYLGSLHEMGKYGEFEKLLEEMENIPTKTLSDEAETFQNVYFYKSLWYTNTHKYRLAEELVPVIKQGLKKYYPKINEAREVTFYHNMVILYFIQGGREKFRTASKLLNEILRSEKRIAREDIKRFAWVLEIILHHELGSDKVLEHIFNTAKRELELKKKKPHKFEELTFKHLKGFLFAPPADKKTLLRAFREDLRAFAKENKHFGMEELDLWINSKIRNCTIADILREESNS